MANPTPPTQSGELIALPSLGDLNPLSWLGDQAAGIAADGWKAAMIGLWSAGLWLLHLSFKVIDAFTTPDVSASGPLAGALPTTLWLGGTLAVVMMCVQLVVALIRRDGQGLGRVVLGVGQFGAVWVAFLAIGGALVTASGALARGILGSMLNVDSWSQFSASDSWPREVSDATTATVLGVCSFLLLIPAAFAYLIVMLVREAALIILLVTTPISAAGLVADSTRSWFWKSLRWFFASLLVAPAAALILGIGVSMSNGVVQGAGDKTTAAVGTAVVGCVLVMIGAVCPMVLFKLLAFVDPGTGSGAAMRQSMSDAGGMSGLMSGSKNGTGTSAAAQSDGGGRSAGEASAESAGTSRMAGAMGALGAGIGMATSMATRAADLASDVLGSAGIGDPGYSAGFADNAAKQRGGGGGMSPNTSSGESPDTGDMQPGGQGGGSGEPPQPPSPSIGTGDLPGGGASGPKPGGPGGGRPMPGGGAGGAGGAAGGGAADAAVPAL